MIKLDAVDKKLLEMLQQDSKVSVNELSKKLNLTKSPIYDRIKRFENSGLIEKYVAVLDSKKVESIMVIFCSVSLENQKLDAIEAFGLAIETLQRLWSLIDGRANDFLLKVIVKDLEAYHQFSSVF